MDNDNSKFKKKSGEFRFPRDVMRRQWLLKKLKALKNECPTRIVVRPYQNLNKDQNIQKTLPVSIPIQHYNKAETIKDELLSKQTSTTATETAVNDLGPNYMVADNDFNISQGPNGQNKNTTDYGNHSSPEIIMSSNQEQTNNIRQDIKTTDIFQTFGSLAQNSTSKFIPEISSHQFNETLHGSGSIGDDNNLNALRNVRKKIQEINYKTSRHNLPSTVPLRPKYCNLFQNNPVTPQTNESVFHTSNKSASEINNKVRCQKTPPSVKMFNKEIQTNIEVKNQSTYIEHEYNSAETQTDSLTVTDEQSNMIDLVISNNITLEEMKEFLKKRDNGTIEMLNNFIQQTNDNENKSDNKTINSEETGIENSLVQAILAYSNQYKMTLNVIADIIKGDGFQIMSKTANAPLDVKLNTILKYLQLIYNDNEKQKESNKINDQSVSEGKGDICLKHCLKPPNNVNDVTDHLSSSTMSNEITISNTDNRNKTTTRMQATLKNKSQGPAQQRAPFVHDTRMQWSPKPNPPQHFQPQLPPQSRPILPRESMIEYPKLMHAHTLQQPRHIRPQNLPNVNEQMSTGPNYSNIPDHSVTNAQHHRFANHQAQMLDRQQYQIQQERYRQMEFQKIAWESHMASNPNDMGGDFDMYNGGTQVHH